MGTTDCKAGIFDYNGNIIGSPSREYLIKHLIRIGVIFQNFDSGRTWSKIVIDSGPKDFIDHHDGTVAADMDNDGDLDIISVGWYNPKVWLYKKYLIYIIVINRCER